mmetsp:Transcript_20969/g.30408  ORF Transcript_20969/g.30408 Transcript_20969/m.30408 type:complete len:267 (+) Transcript_20969:447-1247(+)
MGPMGCPAPSCMDTSMSSKEASPLSAMDRAWPRYGTSNRLTMNPGVSLHDTGVFPREAAHPLQASKTAGSVPSVRTTSTSLISCTGLKKCRPTTRSGLPEASAISWMGREDVLDARTPSGFTSFPRFSYKGSLMAGFSVIASTTKSHEARSSRLVVYESLERISCSFVAAAPSSSFPLLTFFANTFFTEASIRFFPASIPSATESRATTSYPAVAVACAIPWPIKPRPIIPTFLMSGAVDKSREKATPLARTSTFGHNLCMIAAMI